MNIGEHENEPQPGLPEALPEGERLLWQGAPQWRTLARESFHLRKLAVYFALLIALRGVFAAAGGAGIGAAIVSALWLVPLAGLALGLLALLAWLNARATLYTITDRRVVMRIGVALSMTINLPFKRIEAAACKRGEDGHGDIALTLSGNDRLAWLHLWPHVRGWQLSRPQPALRALADVAPVAELLAAALARAAAADTAVQADVVPAQAAPVPVAPVAAPANVSRDEPSHPGGHDGAWVPAS